MDAQHMLTVLRAALRFTGEELFVEMPHYMLRSGAPAVALTHANIDAACADSAAIRELLHQVAEDKQLEEFELLEYYDVVYCVADDFVLAVLLSIVPYFRTPDRCAVTLHVYGDREISFRDRDHARDKARRALAAARTDVAGFVWDIVVLYSVSVSPLYRLMDLVELVEDEARAPLASLAYALPLL